MPPAITPQLVALLYPLAYLALLIIQMVPRTLAAVAAELAHHLLEAALEVVAAVVEQAAELAVVVLARVAVVANLLPVVVAAV
jgi:hypothetical protein